MTTPKGMRKPTNGTPEQWASKARLHLDGAFRALKDNNPSAAVNLLDDAIQYAWAADISHEDEFWANAQSLQSRLPDAEDTTPLSFLRDLGNVDKGRE